MKMTTAKLRHSHCWEKAGYSVFFSLFSSLFSFFVLISNIRPLSRFSRFSLTSLPLCLISTAGLGSHSSLPVHNQTDFLQILPPFCLCHLTLNMTLFLGVYVLLSLSYISFLSLLSVSGIPASLLSKEACFPLRYLSVFCIRV